MLIFIHTYVYTCGVCLYIHIYTYISLCVFVDLRVFFGVTGGAFGIVSMSLRFYIRVGVRCRGPFWV